MGRNFAPASRHTPASPLRVSIEPMHPQHEGDAFITSILKMRKLKIREVK